MKSFPEAPAIGPMIRAVLHDKKNGKSKLYRMLGVNSGVVTQYMHARGMRTSTLWKLSHALEVNFFANLAAKLPSHFASDVPVDTSQAARIAELERELELMTRERDLLLSLASLGMTGRSGGDDKSGRS